MRKIKLVTLKTNKKKIVTHITPSKILCVGRNYVDHVHELANDIPDEMVIFFKPNSAITTLLNSVHYNEKLHYEAELCFLYQQGRFTAVALGLDLTKRDLQDKLKKKSLPWERAKAFNDSAVLSHFITIDSLTDEAFNNLSLSLNINGKTKQQGGVQHMIFKPNNILQDLQNVVTLEDGDVIMTGTPKGVGVISAGDNFYGRVYISNNIIEQSNTLLNCHWIAQ